MARVCGKTWWQWGLLSSTALYHVIADTRAARVITDFLGGIRPEVWVADRYAGQAGHADSRQLCLAHGARPTPNPLSMSEMDPIGETTGVAG